MATPQGELLRPRRPEGRAATHRPRYTAPVAGTARPADPELKRPSSSTQSEWALETWDIKAKRHAQQQQQQQGTTHGQQHQQRTAPAASGWSGSVDRFSFSSNTVALSRPGVEGILARSACPHLQESGVGVGVGAAQPDAALAVAGGESRSGGVGPSAVFYAACSAVAVVASLQAASVDSVSCEAVCAALLALSAAVAAQRSRRCAEHAGLLRKLHDVQDIVLPPRSTLLDSFVREDSDTSSSSSSSAEDPVPADILPRPAPVAVPQEARDPPPPLRSPAAVSFRHEEIQRFEQVSLHTSSMSVPEVDPVWRRTGGAQPVMRIA